jgi:hypothetical protein
MKMGRTKSPNWWPLSSRATDPRGAEFESPDWQIQRSTNPRPNRADDDWGARSSAHRDQSDIVF